jgi:hypothetical protein
VNDVEELKRFVVAQAHSQGITAAEYGPVLARVTDDRDGTPGSWAREWSVAAERLEDEGRLLEAARFWTMARFPHPDGDARAEAQQRAQKAFARWAADFPAITALEVPTPSGTVRAYAGGLSATGPKPLLLMCGGIISLKEQWAPVLLQLAEYGLAGVVTEMPGVGENPLRYGPDSPALIGAVLDAVAGVADTARTYALALSFSGNLALHASLTDPRLRGVIGAGLPVHDFFTDRDWRPGIPRITVETTAALAGTTPERVFDELRPLALTHDQLRAVPVPVAHVTSARDEIVPPSDTERLRRGLRSLRLRVHDDVHGSPSHLAETRLWTVLSVLRIRGGALEQRLALGEQLRAAERAAAAGRTPGAGT